MYSLHPVRWDPAVLLALVLAKMVDHQPEVGAVLLGWVRCCWAGCSAAGPGPGQHGGPPARGGCRAVLLARSPGPPGPADSACGTLGWCLQVREDALHVLHVLSQREWQQSVSGGDAAADASRWGAAGRLPAPTPQLAAPHALTATVAACAALLGAVPPPAPGPQAALRSLPWLFSGAGMRLRQRWWSWGRCRTPTSSSSTSCQPSWPGGWVRPPPPPA